MNILSRMLSLTVLGLAMKANAQQPAPATPPASAPAAAAPTPAKPPKTTAQSEAGEPRADTSRPTTPQSEAGEPRANTSRTSPGTARPSARPAQKPPGTSDRLELGTATVTGDREQPKVMYIVPWKKSDIGDLAGKPMNSLVDEILAPVDRDVFKREVVYYKAVQADASQNGAPARPPPQGEK
ncbi:MAG: hypothetical protein M3N91_17255 [Pseudomonadota bacterium]|nr:hypothetical protein [Pseudomonadota bacterium]